ncbi:MAG TPA: DNA alkylation repair protein [bacterium]|nr:DNA alkylation repair protein [bacterium]
MEYSDIIACLKFLSDPDAVEGMARFGITAEKVYGVSIPNLRKLARIIGKNHELALKLWEENARETRVLASMIDDPEQVTEQQIEKWVYDFDSWEVCDQCIMNLFEKTSSAWNKAVEWSSKDDEFVKRAGFVMMARLAVSDKKASDKQFCPFFPIIKKASDDNRNFVKKAVNWALRQIGKRNRSLHKKAIKTSREIQVLYSKSARWIASDALRELESEKVLKRLGK